MFGLLLIALYDCSFLSTVTAVHTKVELFCSILSWFVSECLALQTITDTVLHKINTALAYTGISTFYDNVKRTQQLPES